MGLFDNILKFARNINVKTSFGNRTVIPFIFGAIYQTRYISYKKDPNPLILILYSDANKTHAINIHYLDNFQKAYILKMIKKIKESNLALNGSVIYQLLKRENMGIVRKAYRVYFTNKLNGNLVSCGMSALTTRTFPSSDLFVKTLNNMLVPKDILSPVGKIDQSNQINERLNYLLNKVPLSKVATVKTQSATSAATVSATGV